MTQKEVLDDLKAIVVERLRFDPRRAADMTLETTLPKGVDGSLGPGLARLHRALGGHGRAIRDHHRGRAGSRGGVPLPRQPLALHPRQDGPGMTASIRHGALLRMTRVVVSGLGVVSPYGAGAKTFWGGLAAGVCAIRPITLIETDGFRSRIAAEVPARRHGRARRLVSPCPRGSAGAGRGARGAGRRRAQPRRARGRRPHHRRGGRRHARGRGLVLGGDANRAAIAPHHGAALHSSVHPCRDAGLAAGHPRAEGDHRDGLRLGRGLRGPGRRPDPPGHGGARARGRSGRAHPHLLHGVQRPQAPGARAVPALRPHAGRHVHRRSRRLPGPGRRRRLPGARRARARGVSRRRA